MQTLPSIYLNTLNASRDAFAQGTFLVAYYTLVSAMQCAIELESITMLKEVGDLAKEQLQAIYAHYQKHPHWKNQLKSLFIPVLLLYLIAKSNRGCL